MNENPNCERCELHRFANEGSVCLKGEGRDSARLLIFLDEPNFVEDRRGRGLVSEGAELLRFMLRRMSLKPTEYYIDYVLKCHHGKCGAFSKKANRQNYIESCSVYRIATLQLLRPAAIVGMGRICCETFVGSDKIGNYEGTKWTPQESFVRDFVENVWLTYAPAFALQSPADSVGIYRVLQAAAIEAGLNPHFDSSVKVKPEMYGV
jgi:uracil-DNA glycosylase family 4